MKIYVYLSQHKYRTLRKIYILYLHEKHQLPNFFSAYLEVKVV